MDSELKEVKKVRKMKEGAIYRPEEPVPHNKCEHCNRHQTFLQPGERKNFKSLLPPMPVANMDFIK
jgi:hypothetical protein